MKRKKLIKLIIFIFILALVINFIKVNHINKKKIEEQEKIIKEDTAKMEEYEKRLEGMKVTMIGGSNMKEKGDVNSCGYVVRTKNDKLILVDGGRDIDSETVLEYIKKFGNGKVDYWFITHPHYDHVGALVEILKKEDVVIENLCYSFNSKEWYEKYDKRGFETEEKIINELDNKKIINKIECQKNQTIDIDNVSCKILRIANPDVIDSDNGNDSSMVFKITAKDVNKSMLFLGDAYIYTSKELLENPEELKADAVQMAHHGQNGVTKEVYENIKPEICFFSAPEWLYNNDMGLGVDSGTWQSITVRKWMEEMGTYNIVAFQGDRTVCFTRFGIEL